MLKQNASVTTGQFDLYGTVGVPRPNHLITPTNDAGVRRAMFTAIDQRKA